MADRWVDRAERRRVVLEAAMDELCSAPRAWIDHLTVHDVAEAAGLTGTVELTRLFPTADDLVAALVEHCCRTPPPCRPGATPSILDRVRGEASALAEATVAPPRFGSQVAIWSVATARPDVADRLRAAYRDRDRLWGRLATRLLSPAGRVGIAEAAVLCGAAAEGLALRRHIEPEMVPAGLLGDLVVLMLQRLADDEPLGAAAARFVGPLPRRRLDPSEIERLRRPGAHPSGLRPEQAGRSPVPSLRHEILDRCAEQLVGASLVRWEAMSADDLGSRVGLDPATITDDLGGPGRLRRAIVAHCLSTGEEARDSSPDHADVVEGILGADETGLDDKLRQLGDVRDRLLRTDRRLLARMAIWTSATTSPAARGELRTASMAEHDDWLGVVARIVAALASTGADRRPGWTLGDAAVASTAVIEGLALRRAVDPVAVAEHLTGDALVALVEGAVIRSAHS